MKQKGKFIEMIREQGSKGNPPRIELVEMLTDSTCEYKGIPLDNDDYRILNNVEVKKGDQVLIYELNDDSYVILGKVV